MDEYVSKADCEKSGFVRLRGGRFYRLNTLERYARDGHLDLGDKRYSAIDRVSAGNRLARDFYLAGLDAVFANDVGRIRVDGAGAGTLSEKRLLARDRFNKACQAVPFEFWPVVNRVCCEDKELEATGGSERQIAYRRYALFTLLCLGLDRLIAHYRKNYRH